MLSATHRSRHLFLAFLLTSLGILLSVRPAHGAWSADPVEVHATGAVCPLVSVTTDASGGSIVVWQENTASGGLLKAKRLLASGDLDPAWSGAVAVSSVDVARVALGTVSDGSGGAYVWWMENAMLMLSRVAVTGSVAAGWPATGRNVGSLPSSQHRPRAVSDGAGGIYLGWLSRSLFPSDSPTAVRVVHLGPSAAGVAGWPSGGRSYGTVGVDNATVMAFGIDRASDGGLWLGWVTNAIQPFMSAGPGEIRAVRLAASGLAASGWTTSGIALATYPVVNASNFLPVPQSHVAMAHDEMDGAFLLTAARETPDGSTWYFHDTLRHLNGAGTSFGDWEDAGLDLGTHADAGDFAAEQGSVRAFADGHGGVYVGIPSYGSEFTAMTFFSRIGSDGGPLPGGTGSDHRGQEYAARDDGGMFIASFKPSGATGPYEANAYISVGQSGGGSFFESKVSYSATRYGDIGLAATDDGGAIFAWSQLIDRQGVYAIRLGPAGAVTDVTPLTQAPPFRAWFVRGEGVRVTGGTYTSTLRVHDVTGREVARATFDRAGEWTVPGTADLASGIYFVSTAVGGSAVRSRVAVVR